MELIDRNALISHLSDYALQEAPFNGDPVKKEIYETILECIKAVEEAPIVERRNLEWQ